MTTQKLPTGQQGEVCDKISAGGTLTATTHSQTQESEMENLVNSLLDELNDTFDEYGTVKRRLEQKEANAN